MMCKETKQYRSPIKKLATFFERSRNRWKRKCLDSKQRVKLLQTKVADLQASRERWKQEARVLRSEVARLRAECEAEKTAATAQ
jgi:hypothetical protein